ncbi:hypothetical protein L593_10635 [Salinarchaeum sp. Harcht-Bsk1]|uniref:hypothetical protein n=1 Tax=Salinarchaeum sp. Harcht-Bsk1 TaxID=1333523 RepID=UPI0003423F80|nr:hypothetical protein [Salinarchaeum sp. Harcht-Bsk1]AGN02072.1 hypothetical protein L593_10635 [Salinarchaeum sp. Harcht-Bsk1]
MRSKLVALALVAAVALATSGAAAAVGANPAIQDADESTAEHQLPDDYTVEVTDRHGVLSDAEVEAAIQAAWADEEVRSYFENADDVHFDLWAPDADEDRVMVSVAPADEPGQTRVYGNYLVGADTFTDVREPLTANESTTMDVQRTADGNFEVEDGGSLDPAGDEPTNLTADESVDIDVELGSAADGTLTVQYDDANATIVSDDGAVAFSLPDLLT